MTTRRKEKNVFTGEIKGYSDRKGKSTVLSKTSHVRTQPEWEL